MGSRESSGLIFKLQKRLKNHKLVWLAATFVAAVAAVGTVAGSFSTIGAFWTTYVSPPDDPPRTFYYANQSIKLIGGNGTSRDQAILISGALTSDAGIAAQTHWVRTFYPDYRVISQALSKPSEDQPRYLDVLVIESSVGFQRQLFFDVTEFFGTPVSDAEQQKQVEKWMLEQVREQR